MAIPFGTAQSEYNIHDWYCLSLLLPATLTSKDFPAHWSHDLSRIVILIRSSACALPDRQADR
jgi:hypothetical protein